MRVLSTVNGKEIKVLYAHLAKMYFKAGEKIKTGQTLGATGKTGNASSDDNIIPHLHVEVQENINGAWIKVDPEKYLTTKFDTAGNRDPNTGNCKQ